MAARQCNRLALSRDTIVVTSRALVEAPARTASWHKGLQPLPAHLAGLSGGDAWVCGGGALQSALIEIGGLDYLEIFVVPVLIGGGTRLWPGSATRTVLELDDARHIDNGIVRLAYRRLASGQR